jgi:hypothetical protein
MELDEFVRNVDAFSSLGHSEKIKLFGWFIHVHRRQDRFDANTIRKCYDDVHVPQPSNVNPLLTGLATKNKPDLLKDSRGYRLSAEARGPLDAKYGRSSSVVVVENTLADLPLKVTDAAESIFLSEALTCYRHRAFRAAIVMTWNLAYDHLLRWLLADASRHATFNARIGVRYPKKAAVQILKRDDFEELKESEVIEIASSAGVISGNIAKILNEKLTRRNIAAHPSTISIQQYQADDVISDLVNNVVLRLL